MSFDGHQNTVALPLCPTGAVVLLLWTDILDTQQCQKKLLCLYMWLYMSRTICSLSVLLRGQFRAICPTVSQQPWTQKCHVVCWVGHEQPSPDTLKKQNQIWEVNSHDNAVLAKPSIPCPNTTLNYHREWAFHWEQQKNPLISTLSQCHWFCIENCSASSLFSLSIS